MSSTTARRTRVWPAANLALVWLRDDSLEDMDNLPPPDVIAQEIVEILKRR